MQKHETVNPENHAKPHAHAKSHTVNPEAVLAALEKVNHAFAKGARAALENLKGPVNNAEALAVFQATGATHLVSQMVDQLAAGISLESILWHLPKPAPPPPTPEQLPAIEEARKAQDDKDDDDDDDTEADAAEESKPKKKKWLGR